MAQQIVTLRYIKKKCKRTKGIADMAHAMAVDCSTEGQLMSLPTAAH
jgi:hypothetical protein